MKKKLTILLCLLMPIAAFSQGVPKQPGQATGKPQAKRAAAGGIKDSKNPNLLWLSKTLMERQVNNYPGGKSPFEVSFARNVQTLGISRQTLSKIVAKLEGDRPQILTRVNNQVKGLTVQKQVTFALLRSTLSRTNDRAHSPAAPASKYAIRLHGLKCLCDIDDVGWEWGPDKQEPFILWSCFGPGYLRTGVTEDGKDVTKGSIFQFKKDINIFSVSEESNAARTAPNPLIFLYQVIENDPDGPTREDYKQAIKTVTAFGTAIAEQNWAGAGALGPDIVDVGTVIMNAVGGGDDFYPLMFSAYDNQRLYEFTSGKTLPPPGSEFFKHPGHYRGFSIQVEGTPEAKPCWSVLYTITRQ